MHHGKDPLKRVGCPAITMTAAPTALLLSIRPDLRPSANRSVGHSKLSPDPGFDIFYAFGNVYAIGASTGNIGCNVFSKGCILGVWELIPAFLLAAHGGFFGTVQTINIPRASGLSI